MHPLIVAQTPSEVSEVALTGSLVLNAILASLLTAFVFAFSVSTVLFVVVLYTCVRLLRLTNLRTTPTVSGVDLDSSLASDEPGTQLREGPPTPGGGPELPIGGASVYHQSLSIDSMSPRSDSFGDFVDRESVPEFAIRKYRSEGLLNKKIQPRRISANLARLLGSLGLEKFGGSFEKVNALEVGDLLEMDAKKLALLVPDYDRRSALLDAIGKERLLIEESQIRRCVEGRANINAENRVVWKREWYASSGASESGVEVLLERIHDSMDDSKCCISEPTFCYGEKIKCSGSFSDTHIGEIQACVTIPVCIKTITGFYNDNAMGYRSHRSARIAKLKSVSLLEISCWMRLKHVNILPIYGYGVSQSGEVVIFSEVMEGGNLATYLRRGRGRNATAADRLDILRQIGEGMEYMHSKNVVHRDIKLENVLVGPNATPKICDFGSARDVTSGGAEGAKSSSLCGTAEYIPPEMISHDKSPLVSALHKMDVYAFGILIWAVMVGKIPYSEWRKRHPSGGEYAFILQLHKGHRNNRRNGKGKTARGPIRPNMEDLPEGCPPELCRLMERCWDEDPNARPNDFAEIVRALESIINE